MGWFKAKVAQKQDQAAINYRMRLAARIGSGNAALNLQEYIEIIAPRLDPTIDFPRTWTELLAQARKMDSMPLAEGKQRFGSEPDSQGMDITRLATWLLGDYGVAKRITYKDFLYRWE